MTPVIHAQVESVAAPARRRPSPLRNAPAEVARRQGAFPSGSLLVFDSGQVSLGLTRILTMSFKKKNFFSNKRSHSNPQSQRWSTLGGGVSFPGNTSGSAPVSDSQVRLHLGMQVLLTSANEMAFLRYLGMTDFAPGLWLGLELQSPKGKNDGSVGGRRYFSCRPGHGVMVRPSRVTYRGINGARLLNDGH